MRIVIEHTPEMTSEDGGQARIFYVEDPAVELFLRIQSFAENGQHPLADQLAGRRLRVTIEVLDEAEAELAKPD